MQKKYHVSNRRSTPVAIDTLPKERSLLAQVGDRIRSIRLAKNLSLRKVREQGGPSADLLGRAEDGLVNLSIATLNKVAKALDVPIRDFFAFGDEVGAFVYETTDAQFAFLKLHFESGSSAPTCLPNL